MRIAVMSDIHGNAVALEAVLEHCRRDGDVDEYWILGDIAALGPAPVQVLERISGLENARCTRGNTDRYVCTGDRPPPSMDDASRDPAHLPALVECAGTFAWTQGVLTQAGWLSWLADLPLEIDVALPDGTKVLGVHAAPGRDGGLGFKVGLTDHEYRGILGPCDADLLFTGHHHRQLDVSVNRTRVVNVGSVSLSLPPDIRAGYALLEADSSGHQLGMRQVDYDREAVVQAVQALGHPGVDHIVGYLRGQREESVGERPAASTVRPSTPPGGPAGSRTSDEGKGDRTPEVLVPIADGTEELEAISIIDILRRARASVTIASVDGSQVTASRGTVLVADALIADCLGATYDLIVLPGGFGAQRLRDSRDLETLLREQQRQGRLYAAICASPGVVLQHHGLLDGLRATCAPGYGDDIEHLVPPEARVVVDGQCVTSVGAGTAIEFALTLVELLFDRDLAREIAEHIHARDYTPPPQTDQTDTARRT